MNITRLSEDLILWSSLAFGVIELPDEFSSTSSMMPQKKNPEVLEVVRARMSHVAANLQAAIMIVKSLPSGYNLDLQEITPKLWETVDCMSSSLMMLTDLLPLLKVNPVSSNLLDFTTSTELANLLTRKYKVPFRIAHRIVGSLVQELVEQKRRLSDATPELLELMSKRVLGTQLKIGAEDIHSCVDPLQVVKAHSVKGGPAPEEVRRALKTRNQTLEAWNGWLSKETDRLQNSSDRLRSLVNRYCASCHGSSH
jgi:argininosuccinate lyase